MIARCFVDTSGFYAFLCRDDPGHDEAVALFQRAGREDWRLQSTSYVYHESAALIQHRLGWEAVDLWLDKVVSACEITFVDEQLHDLGVARWRQARSRRLSLTDCVSFEFMKRNRLESAIAFDAHFSAQGFPRPSG